MASPLGMPRSLNSRWLSKPTSESNLQDHVAGWDYRPPPPDCSWDQPVPAPESAKAAGRSRPVGRCTEGVRKAAGKRQLQRTSAQAGPQAVRYLCGNLKKVTGLGRRSTAAPTAATYQTIITLMPPHEVYIEHNFLLPPIPAAWLKCGASERTGLSHSQHFEVASALLCVTII